MLRIYLKVYLVKLLYYLCIHRQLTLQPPPFGLFFLASCNRETKPRCNI